MMKIVSIYAKSFFGNAVYDLFSKECSKIYSTYNIMVRSIFSLPRESHRFYIEEVSESCHVKVLLASRLVKFQDMLLQSERPAIQLLAKINQYDCRTRFGSNLVQIAKQCAVDPTDLSSYIVRENMKFQKAPPDDEWKIPIVMELIQVRNGISTLSEFNKNDLTNMLNMLTTA